MYDNKSISLADRVFDELEEDILNGKYKEGDILTENKLSELLGVSRTPVREAIRKLEQENIVRSSGKGVVVLGVNLQDMSDIYEIRLRTEGLASRWAATRITEEGISKLREALDLEDFYTSRHDADHLKSTDTTFHGTIYNNCGSEMLESMLINLHRKIQSYRKASLQDFIRAEEAFEEHKKIFNAILSKDEDAAEKYTAEHIINARNSIFSKEKL